LETPEFHPHSLRHSYSHILLELGNPVEVVSRLINHTDVRTTQKYYLKESASETAARATIPWLESQAIGCDPVPSFLRPRRQEDPANDMRRQRAASLLEFARRVRQKP
jgi:hypothetical protein